MSRTDRAVKQLVVDEDVRLVLEFMQDKIEAVKLIGVAEALPQMARLLWVRYPQEPILAASFVLTKECSQSLSHATECGPAMASAGGDSVEAGDAR
jgi:hypothetical protein